MLTFGLMFFVLFPFRDHEQANSLRGCAKAVSDEPENAYKTHALLSLCATTARERWPGTVCCEGGGVRQRAVQCTVLAPVARSQTRCMACCTKRRTCQAILSSRPWVTRFYRLEKPWPGYWQASHCMTSVISSTRIRLVSV